MDRPNEEIMEKLDKRFMRADLLDMTFKHIEGKLDKIEKRLEAILDQFDEKYGHRIIQLENDVEDLKAFKWKLMGAAVLLNGVMVFAFEILFKK